MIVRTALELTGLVLAVVLLALVLAVVIAPIGMYNCDGYSEMSGLDTKYNVVESKCYVKHNGVWVDKDKLLGVHDVSR